MSVFVSVKRIDSGAEGVIALPVNYYIEDETDCLLLVFWRTGEIGLHNVKNLTWHRISQAINGRSGSMSIFESGQDGDS